MQKKYRRRRIALVVLLFVVIAGATLGAVYGVGRLIGSQDGPEPDGDPGDALQSSQGNESQLSGKLSGILEAAAAQAEEEPEPEPEPVVIGDGEAWKLILASASSPLPDGYAPPELEIITESYQVDSRIASSLRKMIADAKLEGITLMICSAYRDQDYQQTLFERQVEQWRPYKDTEEEAIAAASTVVLYPGTSEHQTGLAVDIVTPEYQTLDEGFAETPAAKWMAENSWKYGFVLRYPQDKQDITKVIFEPWHFRYVGEEHAQVIFEKQYCLEEYLYIELRQQVGLNNAVAVSGGETDPDGETDPESE